MWIHLVSLELISGATSATVVDDLASTLGGSIIVKEPKKRHKKQLTDDEIRGMEAVGRARMGISEKIITPHEPELRILPRNKEKPLNLNKNLSDVSFDNRQKSLQEKIEKEDDIALILAIIETHIGG